MPVVAERGFGHNEYPAHQNRSNPQESWFFHFMLLPAAVRNAIGVPKTNPL
jgi:hypothetical protein